MCDTFLRKRANKTFGIARAKMSASDRIFDHLRKSDIEGLLCIEDGLAHFSLVDCATILLVCAQYDIQDPLHILGLLVFHPMGFQHDSLGFGHRAFGAQHLLFGIITGFVL